LIVLYFLFALFHYEFIVINNELFYLNKKLAV
jgi:hypothetical protein